MNVIVVCIDTLRADLITDGREQRLCTPHLQRLCAESIVFEEAYGEAEPTIPCRRSLFTGTRQYPWREHADTTGLNNNMPGWYALDANEVTLAEHLLASGFMTGLISDNFHLFEPGMNCARGFVNWEMVRGQAGDAYRLGPANVELLRPFVLEPVDFRRNAVLWQYLWGNRGRRGEQDWSAAQVFVRAGSWLEDNEQNAPFFLWVDCFAPHEPWDAPGAWARQYLPRGYAGKRFIFPGLARTPEERAACRDLYYGYVAFVDHWLGHFLAALENSSVYADTAVVLVSDHGTELDEDGRLGKSEEHLHAYNTRLNLWLRWPGEPAQRVRGIVQAHDLLPTVLAGLGVSHEPREGRDLWPLIHGQVSTVREYAVTGWGRHACVRNSEFRLILDVNEPLGAKLYRASDDRVECELQLVEGSQDVRARMLRALESYGGRPLPWTVRQAQPRQRPPVYRLAEARFADVERPRAVRVERALDGGDGAIEGV